MKVRIHIEEIPRHPSRDSLPGEFGRIDKIEDKINEIICHLNASVERIKSILEEVGL